MAKEKNRYMKLICSYVFSNKSLQDFDECEQVTLELAIDVLTTHGSGGKFMEKLIRHKFKYSDDGLIHGWDGHTEDSRPVEIKTETINDSKKIFCEASFAPHTKKTLPKKNVYLKEKPIFVNAGLAKNGKCLYVMVTDTALLNPLSMFFTRLDANSPRVNFKHFVKDRDAYEVKYKNLTLIESNSSYIGKELREELTNAARLPF